MSLSPIEKTSEGDHCGIKVEVFQEILKNGDRHTKKKKMSALQRIIKSSSDLRSYKAITLKNKLQCLLVSDSLADKSAASMNVNVGHLQDPIEVSKR